MCWSIFSSSSNTALKSEIVLVVGSRNHYRIFRYTFKDIILTISQYFFSLLSSLFSAPLIKDWKSLVYISLSGSDREFKNYSYYYYNSVTLCSNFYNLSTKSPLHKISYLFYSLNYAIKNCGGCSPFLGLGILKEEEWKLFMIISLFPMIFHFTIKWKLF